MFDSLKSEADEINYMRLCKVASAQTEACYYVKDAVLCLGIITNWLKTAAFIFSINTAGFS
jgi:hypothetical protein